MSVPEDRFTHVPEDIIVPGILDEGDIADAAAVLAPRPMLLEGMVDARNRQISESLLHERLMPIYNAYQLMGQSLSPFAAENH